MTEIDSESSLKVLNPYSVPHIMFSIVYLLFVYTKNHDMVAAQSLPYGALEMNITKLKAHNRCSLNACLMTSNQQVYLIFKDCEVQRDLGGQ